MKFKYTVTGIDCPNCAAKLAALIEKKLTVESSLDADATLATARAAGKEFSSSVKIKK